jgi:hypothetical protein
MRVTVLTLPQCPNALVARQRLAAALAGRPAEVELVEVPEEEQAAARGMTGSPTILFDGVDPFAVAGASCRLYQDAQGTMAGAPSVVQLREALAGAGLSDTAFSHDCC